MGSALALTLGLILAARVVNGAAPPRPAASELPTLILTATDTNLYERIPADAAVFLLTRLGDTNIELPRVTYAFSGTATRNVDYFAPPLFVTVPAGVVTVPLIVTPMDDAILEGDETITLTLTGGGTNYLVGSPASATVRLQDDDTPPAPVLFEDTFDTDTSFEWIQRFGANNGLFDTTALWAYDYGVLGIPPAPHSEDGSTTGLFVQVNKNNPNSRGAAALNLYPAGAEFRGDYALRFDLYLSIAGGATAEHPLCGLNHIGKSINRFTQSPDPNGTVRGGDGVWVALASRPDAQRDYAAFTAAAPNAPPQTITNRAASELAGVIGSPPFAAQGLPGISAAAVAKAWADVELRQLAGRITLKVNQSVVFDFPNPTAFTQGHPMIGLCDSFDDIGPAGNFAVFDNVRVVSLETRIISAQVLADNTLELHFTSPAGAPENGFILEGTPQLVPPVWQPEPATITINGNGGYRAIVPTSAANRFYRLRR